MDGREPKDSGDTGLPRFTWWDHKGGREWVQHEFDVKRKVSGSRVYWFDDRAAGGGCRVPASWTLMHRDAASGEWRPVKAKGDYGVQRDRFNAVEFEPVETAAVRLEAQLQKDYSGGILEWRLE